MDELTDAEVFGNIPQSPPVQAPLVAPQRTLSDAEVFGEPAVLPGSAATAAPSASASASPAKPLSDEEVFGEKPYAATRGLVSGFLEDYPKAAAGTLEGLSHLVPEHYKPALQEYANYFASKAGAPAEYQRTAKPLRETQNMQDFMTWAGETFGQGVSTTAAPLALSVAGGAAGTPGGPVGQAIGAATGGVLGGSFLNYNEVYQALKDEKVDPARAAKLSLAVLPVISAFDAYAPFMAVGRTLGLGSVKEKLIQGLAKRIATYAAKSSAEEGATEGAQEFTKQIAISAETGKPLFTKQNAWDIVENVLGGALVGGPYGAVSGVPKPSLPKGPATEEQLRAAFANANTPEGLTALAQTLGTLQQQGQQAPSFPGGAMPEVSNAPPIVPREGVIASPAAQAPGVTQQMTEGEVYGPGPLWWSKAEKIAESLPEKATAEQILRHLTNAGVKQDELQYTGLRQFLNDKIGEPGLGPQEELQAPSQGAQAALAQWKQENPKQQPPTQMLLAAQQEKKELLQQKGEQAKAQQGAPLVSKQDVIEFLQDHRYTMTELQQGTPHSEEYRNIIKQRDLLAQQTLTVEGQIDALPFGSPQRLALIDQVNGMYDQLRDMNERVRTSHMNPAPYESFVAPGEYKDYRTLVFQSPANMEIIRAATEAGKDVDETVRLVRFPAKHFNQPNNLAHVRLTVREDMSGSPVVYIEEMQTDMHQLARVTGYLTAADIQEETRLQREQDNAYTAFNDELEKSSQPLQETIKVERQARDFAEYYGRYESRAKRPDKVFVARLQKFEQMLSDRYGEQALALAKRYMNAISKNQMHEDKFRKAVPDAPYKMTQDWTRYLMKRVLRWAADHGIQRVSWTNPYLAWQYPTGAAGQATLDDTESYNRLQGMKEYYGKIVPGVAKELARQYGGNVGTMAINFGPEDVHEVHFIEFDKRAQWNFQRTGFSSFALDPTQIAGVRTTEQISPQLTVHQDEALSIVPKGQESGVHRAALQMARAMQDLAKQFGLDGKLDLILYGNQGTVDISGLPPAIAMHTWQPTTGRHYIEINLGTWAPDKFRGQQAPATVIADMWTIMMHEFGHAVFYEHYHKLPASTQHAIKAAHDKFLSDTKGFKTYQSRMAYRMAPTAAHMVGEAPTRMWNAMPQSEREYWNSFEEWIADQVARWAATQEQPLTIVDKAIKGLADVMKAFYQYMQKRLGLSFGPTEPVKEWLNSFLTTNTVPLGWSQDMILQAKEVKSDQRALAGEGDPDVPAAPRSGVSDTIRSAMAAVYPGGPSPTPMAAHASRMNWLYKFMSGLDQLVERNPLFSPLLRYKERVKLMHQDETNVHDAGLRIMKDWRRLGSQAENLTAFINDITNMSFLTPQEVAQGITRNPTPQELTRLGAQHQLSQAALDVYNKITYFSRTMLQLIQQNAIQQARRIITDPVKLMNTVGLIQQQMLDMLSRPFFPFMRFGRYFVKAKNAAGDTIFHASFERRGLRSAESQQQRAIRQLVSQGIPQNMIEHGVLPESSDPFIGLPQALMQQIKTNLALTPSQSSALEDLMLQYSSAVRFPKVFRQEYTKGYSMDFQRSFARFAFHAGRYYAQARHAWELQDDVRAARAVGGNNASEIANYMSDHLRNTILDARGDYGIFKGGIFLWAMGYVPAAATQNLTQTPMITFPFLAAKFGDIKASRAITKAMSQLSSFYKRGTYDNLTAFEMKAISYGIRNGVITETQAPELAGMSQGANLLLGQGGTRAQRWYSTFMEKASWMFEMAEQWNRRIAFRASLNLALQNPQAQIVQESVAKQGAQYNDLLVQGYSPAEAKAILTATYVVNQTQYEYARWARPRFMRGPLPGTLFVFKKYMQSTLFMLANNKSDVLPRYLLIGALMGGLTGIPGYDDLKDILKAVGKWLNKDFDVEKGIRDWYTQHLGANPTIPSDMILHGLARRGFGVGALTDMMGSFFTGTPGRGFDGKQQGQNVPFPILDRHKAITMGPILPVEIGKLFDPTDDLDKTIADQAQRASGAVFSVAFNMYKAIMDNKLEATDWKRWERAIPRELGALSRSFRAFSEGRERSRGGPNSAPTIAEFNWRDTEQAMEMLAMAGGYQPLRVQAKWDSIMAKAEVEKFYDLQRSHLMGQFFEARKGGINDEVVSVQESIRRFNRELPDWARGKVITGDNLRSSLQARERELRSRESGVPVKRSNVGISRHIDELFPESTVDVRRVQ